MRTQSKSSLDFTYWIISNVEQNYIAGTKELFEPTVDHTIMRQAIRNASAIVGVTVPNKHAAILAAVERYESDVNVLDALHTRGAVLRAGERLVVSMGNGKHLVGVNATNALSIYLINNEDREPSTWDGAFYVPGMVYL